jgi:hypothetical protein
MLLGNEREGDVGSPSHGIGSFSPPHETYCAELMSFGRRFDPFRLRTTAQDGNERSHDLCHDRRKRLFRVRGRVQPAQCSVPIELRRSR